MQLKASGSACVKDRNRLQTILDKSGNGLLATEFSVELCGTHQSQQADWELTEGQLKGNHGSKSEVRCWM